MKKLLILFFALCFSGNTFSQIKNRNASVNFYTGIGYRLVFLTDNTARDAYPFFQLSNGDFLKEITGQFGAVINEVVGVEFAPSYLFTNAYSFNGFYYTSEAGRRYYVPSSSRLFAFPLNARVKYFPQGKNYTSFLNKAYVGAGIGMMYLSEEIVSQVYTDNVNYNYINTVRASNDFWNINYEIAVGIASYSKIGYGFELNYRFVPFSDNAKKPLITSISQNFNSVNLTANIIFSF
ncbi:MAG: hypothetical protein JSS91_12360 [Bacteroidetes bacterium]|nr:hypothetical protein [Bacteroidota bacterium]